eukprot:Lankesteria_metandrocarpae@DN5339_c0_g1_i1.p2
MSDDDSSSSSVEDEGELLTAGLQTDIFRTLAAVKSRDPRIYDESFSFYRKQQNDDNPDIRQKGIEGDQTSVDARDGNSVSKQSDAGDDLQLMKRYFGDNDSMNDSDMFLRDYILFEGWRREMPTRRQLKQSHPQSSNGVDDDVVVEVGDDADDQHLTAVDNYERKWNFRFEELEKGEDIDTTGTVNPRTAAAAARSNRKDTESRRKRERRRRKERKEADLAAARSNLSMERKEKVKEINARLASIGTHSQGGTDLQMPVSMLDGEDVEGEQCTTMQDEEDVLDDTVDDSTSSVGEWWLCDGCDRPIKPGRKKYDCIACDVCFCAKCEKSSDNPTDLHVHPLVKATVKKTCHPPAEWDASASLPAHTGNLSSSSGVAGSSTLQEKVEALVADKLSGDVEDVVGGMSVRYKYHAVPKPRKTLTTEQILKMSPSQLERRMPLADLLTHDGLPVFQSRNRRFKGSRRLSSMRNRAAAGKQRKTKSDSPVGKPKGSKPKAQKKIDTVPAATGKTNLLSPQRLKAYGLS